MGLGVFVEMRFSPLLRCFQVVVCVITGWKGTIASGEQLEPKHQEPCGEFAESGSGLGRACLVGGPWSCRKCGLCECRR